MTDMQLPELRTSAEWLPILYPGGEIMDYDGWRGTGAPDYNRDLITAEEFRERYNQSTVKKIR